MKRLVGFASVVCLLVVCFACLAPPPAGANALPVRREGLGTGMVVPEDVPVAILSQKLTIELRLPPRHDWLLHAQAQVQAVYHLENRSGEKQQLDVAFLGWGLGSRSVDWQVRLAGESLPVREDPSTSVLFPGLTSSPRGLDPFTGQTYQPRHAAVDWPRAMFFPVVLEPGQQADLEVSYVAPCGFDSERYVNPVFQYSYLLSPARHWADFGSLEVRVRVPRGVRAASNLPLAFRQGEYVGTFGDLPADELTVACVSRSGMWFGRYTTRGAAGLAMLGALGAAASLLRLLARKTTGRARIAAQCVVLLGTVWFLHVNLARQLLPYPFNLAQPPLMAVVWLVALLYAVRLWRRRPAPHTPVGPTHRSSG